MIDATFDAFLFDMDGTLINSIPAAERVWGAWALSHGLDVAAFLATIHGVRAVETIGKLGLPGIDPIVEAERISAAEAADLSGTVPIAGAARLLARLPPGRWAIVTSSPRELAHTRMAYAGLPRPAVFVTAEDVTRGKPAPDCFRLAAERLGVAVERCLVFEDAPAGIAAAEAAGARVAVITATHRHALDTGHPTLDSYERLSVEIAADGLKVHMAGG